MDKERLIAVVPIVLHTCIYTHMYVYLFKCTHVSIHTYTCTPFSREKGKRLPYIHSYT